MKHFAPKWTQLKPPSFGRLVYSFIIATLLICALSPIAQHLERSTSLPLLFSLRGPIPAPENIVIIALNSSAAKNLKQSHYSGNWPRTIHAELINRLHQAKAQLTVMDIAFKDEHSEDEDSALEQALAHNPKVLLFTYLKRQHINTGAGIMDIEQEIPPIARFRQHALASGSFTLPKYPAYVYNTPLVNQLTDGPSPTQPVLAYFAQQSEEDLQALWAVNVHTHNLPTTFLQKTQQLIALVPGTDSPNLSQTQRQLHHTLSDTLSDTKPMTINFYGPAQTLHTLPIDQVLALPESEFTNTFAGKVVYVGFSDSAQTEQQDTYRTIFSSDLGIDLSGVEISATVFANLVNHNYIRTPQPWLLLSITGLALIIGFYSYRAPSYFCAGLQITTLSIYIGVTYSLFTHHQLWLPIALPCIALAIANSFMLSRRFNQNKKRMQHIQFALSQYLPNEAAKKLSRNVSSLEKQHRLVHGVCLMTDIQGYTALSETLAPDVLHKLMNAYYRELVETVEKHGGFIGNLVGDGMLALWTGPKITKEMCKAAFDTAQEIQVRINNNPLLEYPLPTCSALHGGQFSLGNLGAHGHFEYSPVGDIINTTSRVEHFNRNLGTQFLCTAPIAEKLNGNNKNQFGLRHLGSFTFRHKSLRVPLYGLIEDLTKKELDTFSQALSAYENQAFEVAEKLFKLIEVNREDGPSRYFLNEMSKKK